MERTGDRPASLAVAYLALTDLGIGLWAVLDPASWFRDFPGMGHHWIAADPPYNHHLSTDAGAGFVGLGVVLALALFWGERHLLIAALAGSLAHDVPHFLFHAFHPANRLSSLDRFASTGGLGFGCVVAVGGLVWLLSRPGADPPAGRN
ncbi:MAG: hypothetical protein NVSMB16_11650 [Acidimicrobiales bacterium]